MARHCRREGLGVTLTLVAGAAAGDIVVQKVGKTISVFSLSLPPPF